MVRLQGHLRFREVEQLGEGHTVSKWPSGDQNLLTVQNRYSHFMLLAKWCITGLVGALAQPEEARKAGL